MIESSSNFQRALPVGPICNFQYNYINYLVQVKFSVSKKYELFFVSCFADPVSADIINQTTVVLSFVLSVAGSSPLRCLRDVVVLCRQMLLRNHIVVILICVEMRDVIVAV